MPAFECVGFTPKDKRSAANCGTCGNYDGVTCRVKDELNELYEESPRFKALDRLMRTNKGISGTMF
ncbi:hypothetical protein [Desulfosporosinus youngiae]|uniref:hypothetical protein n=1 Tax=Desulfosporosinus youngiae TaxID=339862 RepID=UPI0002FEFD18|nr:hypothetical protein [Desulfosporosinus youngiae]